MRQLEKLVIKNSYVEMKFDLKTGLPAGYRLIAENGLFDGALESELISARICHLTPRKYQNVTLEPVSYRNKPSIVTFTYKAYFDGEPAVMFDLRYELDRTAILVTLDEVSEFQPFELIEVNIPCLVSISGTAGKWLAHCRNSGSFVSLKDAKSGDLPEHPYFAKILHILPVVMLGIPEAVCTMEVTAYNDGTLLHVEDTGVLKRARFGTIKTYRVDGSAWCNSNDVNLALVYGNENTPNLIVEQKSSCRIDFTGDYDHNGKVNWLDGAKLIHDRMPRMRTDYYDDKFMYVVGCDHPTIPKPRYTLPEATQLIKDISSLTDNSPQIVCLTGWQIEGMDTGYPAVDTIGERIGGYKEYLKLKDATEDVNCNVTLHDNFDDTYPHSKAWDPDMVARLPDGSLWKSNLWTRDESYIQGLAKYMTKGPGVERIDYTCKKYKLHNTAHVDVLSWFAIRHDWDPQNPASGIKNLFEGKYRIFDEFFKHGLDLTSESLRYPWIGKMTVSFCENDMFGACPFGGSRIPILPVIYKNVAIYGDNGNKTPALRSIRLLYNIHPVLWHSWTHPKEEELQRQVEHFYLIFVPWFKLHRLETLDYTRDGDVEYMYLEGNSSITVNEAANTYSVKLNGVEVCKNDSVFCPLDRTRIAFYSLNAEELSFPVPVDWTTVIIKANALYAGRREPAAFRIAEGRIFVKVSPRVPVIVAIEV